MLKGSFFDIRVILSKSVIVKITGGPDTPEVKSLPKHKKNAEVGEKKTVYSSVIIISQEDAESFNSEANEEVKLRRSIHNPIELIQLLAGDLDGLGKCYCPIQRSGCLRNYYFAQYGS